MRDLNKKNNKHGGVTVFLAVILSALVFVNAIYLNYIIDIDRRVMIERALKQQLDVILSRYNEQLFLEYGIYGFFMDDVDSTVYQNVIEATGYSYGEDIYIDGYRTLNTVQLEKAIRTYYSYRSVGIIANNVKGAVTYMFGELDKTGFTDKLKKFSSSGGNKALNFIGKGAKAINEILGSDEVSELIDLTTADQSLLGKLFEYIKVSKNTELDFDKDFDPEDFFAFSFLNDVRDVFLNSQNVIEDEVFRLCLSHYCVRNFESHVKEFDGEPDRNIRGTLFTDINPCEADEMEYIISGQSGALGVYSVGHMISVLVQLSEVLNLFMNDKFMKVCRSLSDILSTVSMIFLEGFQIPSWVFQMIIIIYSAMFCTVKSMVDLYNGRSIQVFKFSKAPEPLNEGFSMDYKDFAFVLSLIGNEEVQMSRICGLLEDKYQNKIITKVELVTIYNDQVYSGELGYQMYGF